MLRKRRFRQAVLRTEEWFGAEIGKIGAEGVKIIFEARRKRLEFG